MVFIANETDPPQCTIGHESGDDLVLMDENGTPVTLREDQWNLIEVLTRGKALCDNEEFSQWNDGPDEEGIRVWEAQNEATRGPRPEKRDDPTVKAAFTGISSFIHGPVPTFRGNEFKTEPEGSIAGKQTILHHTMLVRGNLVPTKSWVSGNGSFSTLFSHGSFTLEQIRQASVETMKDLYRGSGITLVYDIDLELLRRQKESIDYVKKRTKRSSMAWTVPEADAVESIVAWSHNFRWTEEMERIAQRPSLVVDHINLNVAELKRLMMQVTSKVPGLMPQSRLYLLPHMMPGSKMPNMVNIMPYRYHTEAELAMTGLGSVYLRVVRALTIRYHITR
ncbi:hypothetical protein V8C35DRAFT_280789 [Trichoderma chlorosporum]